VDYVRDVESVCIAVDAPDHLYVTEHCILTHNTVQAVGVINASPEVLTVCVVCPASLKINWRRECQAWLTRPATILTYGEPRGETHCDWNSLGANAKDSIKIHIINYDILSKLPKTAAFDLLVLDEAHYVKNPKAARSKAVQALAKRCRKVLALTGTPIPNRPLELWSILQLVAPKIWDPPGRVKVKTKDDPKGTYKKVGAGEGAGFWAYAKRYCDAHEERVSDSKKVWVFTGHSNLPELQEKLRTTCMVRRLKEDVLKELPPKRRQVIELPTDKRWSEDRVLDAEHADYDDVRATLGETAFTEFSATRHEQALAKVPGAVDHIRSVLEQVDKVVVFAHHQDVIAKLSEELFDETPMVLTGGMAPHERQRSVDLFQTEPMAKLFIGSLKAAGVGLNLTAASTVIFVEGDWSPDTLSQAEDRVHRIGQKESVLVQHLVLAGTLDADMMRMVTKKQAIADAALDTKPESATPFAVPQITPGAS
jgi:SWI/SNF-related matrix-associated actin-dependent regulator 1 of chromatin subfamily A